MRVGDFSLQLHHKMLWTPLATTKHLHTTAVQWFQRMCALLILFICNHMFDDVIDVLRLALLTSRVFSLCAFSIELSISGISSSIFRTRYSRSSSSYLRANKLLFKSKDILSSLRTHRSHEMISLAPNRLPSCCCNCAAVLVPSSTISPVHSSDSKLPNRLNAPHSTIVFHQLMKCGVC